jgi:uncharacterized repeat protein (TIGR03803 family)
MGCGISLLLAMSVGLADASPVRILFTFDKSGRDGALPNSGVISDNRGNLYGTTAEGGPGCAPAGCGVIFELAPNGVETVLYSFGAVGPEPFGLARDDQGNLYGTTHIGGDLACGSQNVGCGMVYKLAPDGTLTVLHSFAGGNEDGAYPSGGLLRDKSGNLFGTTWGGGTGCGSAGCGTVFKIAANGSAKILYAFCSQNSCLDGQSPEATLIMDKAGNLYGTTTMGGQFGYGTVFKLSRRGAETVLYNFCTQFGRCSDGSMPAGGVTMDPDGNLYGTTMMGGSDGDGTVYKLAPGGTESVIHSFGNDDGTSPQSGVIVDSAGDVFGTLQQAGAPQCKQKLGLVYRISPNGSEKIYCVRSSMGSAGIIERNGYLYGTGTDIDKRKGLGFVFAIKK